MDWEAFKTEWESGFPKISGERLKKWPGIVAHLRADRAVKGIEHLRERYAASEWGQRAPTVYDLQTLIGRYTREDAEASGWVDPAAKPDPTERWWPLGILIPLILDIHKGKKAEAQEGLRRLCAEIDKSKAGQADPVYDRAIAGWSRKIDALPNSEPSAQPRRGVLPVMGEVLDELAFMGPKLVQWPPMVHEHAPVPVRPPSPPSDEVEEEIPF